MSPTWRNSGRRDYRGCNFEALLVAVTMMACLIPFADKAFHMDDPLFLWTARHILQDPIGYYGFTANWYGTDMPMWWISKNPPLASYYLGVSTWLFGDNEVALHLMFLVPAVGLSLGTNSLARRMTTHAPLAALIAVLTPAFVVSGTSVMCDTLMVALYVWAIALWLKGLDEDRTSFLLSSAVLVAL